jgi:DNA-binding protein
MTRIENNTVINHGPKPTINYIYFTISFLDYGVQDVIIRNNYF